MLKAKLSYQNPLLGVCCANLKDNKALMKMGLGLVLVGHVNFLLGALVHGAVLRHINVHAQARTMVYAIANVIAIVAGLFVSDRTCAIRKEYDPKIGLADTKKTHI